MNIYLEIVNVGFSVVLLIWILVDIVRGRSTNENVKSRGFRECGGFSVFTVLVNAMVSVLYLGFGFYEYWNYRIVNSESLFSALTWGLAAVVAVYSKCRIRRWPWVLIFWWVFSSILGLLYVSIYIIVNYFKSIEIPNFLPQAGTGDFASFPLSVLLCFNLLGYVKNRNDLEEPLLQKEEDFHPPSNADVFTCAGIWSKVTFQWLNPLFKTGRLQKLELPHIPSVPQSERADNASALLEESLRKQKNEDSSLPKAILNAVWNSLAINAVFAGSFIYVIMLNFFYFCNFFALQVFLHTAV